MLATGERVGEAARRLRARPGWNPQPRSVDPDAELAAKVHEIRTAAVYERGAQCDACLEARRHGDPDALCAAHLAQALGVRPT